MADSLILLAGTLNFDKLLSLRELNKSLPEASSLLCYIPVFVNSRN